MRDAQKLTREELEKRIADLKARLPAHSVPPSIPDDAVRPVHVTDDEFKDVVLNSPVPALVDFWAPWCMPCHMIAPTLDKIAAEYGERVLVAKVNTDENPRWATHYGVRGIPTMLFIWKGHAAGRIVGVTPAQAIKQQLEQML